jgi:colanic acid biosynthesis glycosyl transferase WcaI
MKILLYSINYPPELISTGKYAGEMAEWLALKGYEVRVVTALPYYPEWKIYEAYASKGYCREVIEEVDVWRCPLYVPSVATGLKRIVHLMSFALSSMPVVLSQVFWRPDIVWIVEPGLMCAPTAWLTARLSGAKAWLHIQDFEVDAAFDMGLVRSDALKKMVRMLESFLMKRFDKISTISPAMLSLLYKKGVSRNKTELIPNWVDTGLICPLPETHKR